MAYVWNGPLKVSVPSSLLVWGTLSQLRMFGWRQDWFPRMEAPPPLWAMYCHPIVLEQRFPPVSSEVPVLQKWLLAFVLSLGTSEKVWLCIHCLPLTQWKIHLEHYLLFLFWAEEGHLLTCHMLQAGSSHWAETCLHLSHPGDTNWEQCSTYSLGSTWQQGTQPWQWFKRLALPNDMEKEIKPGVLCILQPRCLIVRQ